VTTQVLAKLSQIQHQIERLSLAMKAPLMTLVLALMLSAGSPSMAQPAPYGSQPAQSTARGPRPAPRESFHRNLSQMPSNIPIPMPPDAKFMSGYQTQYDGTKPMTYIRVMTANQPAALDSWYRQSLASYGWSSISPPSTNKKGTMITATKNGVSCSINIGTKAPGQQLTALLISFNGP